MLENESRNTQENARNTALLLRQHSIQEPIALVTSANHARRACGLFRKAGVEVIFAGGDDPRHEMETGLWLFWPKATALQINQSNLHEMAGLLAEWWRRELCRTISLKNDSPGE